MTRIERIIIISLFSVLLIQCAQDNSAPDTKLADSWVRSTIDSVTRENNVVLLSIAINRDRQTRYFQPFGTSKEITSSKIDERTAFPVANLSKMFTGIILNNLIEEEELDTERSIGSYLEDVLSDEAKEGYDNVLLSNLIRHRSGITDQLRVNNPTVPEVGREYSVEQLIEDLNQLEMGPDDHPFQYSNFGYEILGYICEKVSGKSFAELLNEYVIHEYDLSGTGVQPSEDQLLNWTRFQEGPHIPLGGTTNPARGIYSSLADLALLQNIQIRSYQDYFERGMTTPLILTERAYSTRIANWRYGMGFIQIQNEDNKYLGYYRNNDGYSSVYLFSAYPNVGITILSTDGGPWLGQLALDLLDGLVDEDKMNQPKIRSLAWTMFSIIDTEGIREGLDWFEENKQSPRFEHIEREVNSIGYRLLREGNVKESIEVFKQNVKDFPESSNVYDSLGEAYLEDGDEELAIVNYQKSLDMDRDNSRAKRVLRRLKNKDDSDDGE